jgi:hypothetical protein
MDQSLPGRASSKSGHVRYPSSLRENSDARLASSSLLKNHEMESFRILAGRCLSGAVDLDVIFWPVGWTLTRGG